MQVLIAMTLRLAISRASPSAILGVNREASLALNAIFIALTSVLNSRLVLLQSFLGCLYLVGSFSLLLTTLGELSQE